MDTQLADLTSDTMESAFSTAFTIWQEINLTNLQSSLDQQGLEIVENQKENLNSRKKLADATREFKKQPTEWKSLIKLYQSEIDNITKRCKFAENCYLNLYKTISELPDPTPLIKTMMDASESKDELTLQLENKRLKSELDQLSQSNSSLKQLQSENVKLKSQVEQLTNQMESTISEKLTQREFEFKKELENRVRIWKEREHFLQRQSSQLSDSLSQLKLQDKDSHTNLYEQQVAGKLAELEIITMDLDRANLKIAGLERENVNLKQQLQTSSNKVSEDDKLASRVKDLESEISTLQTTLEKTKSQLVSTQVLSESTIANLSSQLQDLQESHRQLEERLATMDDYDQIKSEYLALKQVELAGVAEESGSLEHLLALKARKLQDNLTSTQNTLNSMQQELQETKDKLLSQKEEYERQAELAAKLERELEAALREKQAHTHPLTSMDPSSPTTPNSSNTIIPILTSQRDRYRSRNLELENQLKNLQNSIGTLEREVTTLRDDNVKLYEKIRYATSRVGNVDVESGRVEERYGRLYEAKLDPFREFAKREEKQRQEQLPPLDKLLLTATRFFLANRTTRITFLSYALVLHLLVTGMVYRWSTWEECRHDHERWCLEPGQKSALAFDSTK